MPNLSSFSFTPILEFLSSIICTLHVKVFHFPSFSLHFPILPSFSSILCKKKSHSKFNERVELIRFKFTYCNNSHRKIYFMLTKKKILLHFIYVLFEYANSGPLISSIFAKLLKILQWSHAISHYRKCILLKCDYNIGLFLFVYLLD